MTSVVQLEFDETTRILFVRKENKNNDFIKQFLRFQSASITIHESTVLHACDAADTGAGVLMPCLWLL